MTHFRRVEAEIPTAPFISELRSGGHTANGHGASANVRVLGAGLPTMLQSIGRPFGLGERSMAWPSDNWASGLKDFGRAKSFLAAVAEIESGKVIRAKMFQLLAGHRDPIRVERDEHAADHERYHLVLSSSDGCCLRAGGEEALMREGELWWVDGRANLDAWNLGAQGTLHLIFDLRLHERSCERTAA